YQPQGRGKQERLNRFIRERFLAEIMATGVANFPELNDRFEAWVEQVCNTRTHAETNKVPVEAFLAAGPLRMADPGLLHEAFRWSVLRKVSKTAMVAMAGNRYQVDPALVGQQVECRFNPEDLSVLDVFLGGRAAGVAVPFVLSHHVHPGVPQALPPPPQPTGVDYLGLVLAAHEEATVGAMSYQEVPLFDPDTEMDEGDHDDPGDDPVTDSQVRP
ncbi:MAG: Mu transposase domain-containing protein, partial [Acidimicrobiales bacterium]